MLAISSTDSLVLVDQTALKKLPSSLPSCLTLISPPLATCWSSDNRLLFIASETTVHKYDVESNSLVDFFSSTESLTSLVVKDKSSLVFSAGNNVHILEIASAKVSQSFSSHKNTVDSLSLSADSTLLASASSNAVYIHNLTLASQTALRGLPVFDENHITTCTFHHHFRTRLLLGIGKQLVVYDTTRPSGPAKIVSLTEASSSGHIQAISCSPFSKTLVAVATTGGTVGLIDLEKDKGLFRVFNAKVPIASLSFSQEGASIYLGTENGKLLIVDLRALDKPPKTVIVSDTGERITSLSVQPKSIASKPSLVSKAPDPAISTSRKPSATIASVSKPSPARRTVSASLKGKTSTTGAATGLVRQKEPSTKKTFSPLRNPLGISNGGNTSPSNTKDDDFSLQIESLSAIPRTMNSKKDPKSTPVKGLSQRLRTREGAVSAVSPRLRVSPSHFSPLSSVSAFKKSKSPSADDDAVPLRTRTASTTSRTAATTTTTTSPSSISALKKATTTTSRRLPTVSTTTTTTRATRTGRLSSSVAESISAVSVESSKTERNNHLAPSKRSQKSSISPSSTHTKPGGLGVRSRTTISSSSTTVPTTLNSHPLRSQSKSSTITTTTTKGVSDNAPSSHSRTPSPTLSDLEALASPGTTTPVTPLPVSKRKGLLSAGLGTPGGYGDYDDEGEGEEEEEGGEGVNDDLLAIKNVGKGKGKAKSKTVLFRDDDQSSDDDDGDHAEERGNTGKENQRDEESLSLQISPRRPGSIGPSSSMSPWNKNKSPIRHSHSHSHLNNNKYANLGNIPGSPGGTSPQDLLRNIVRDVMYDYHQESRAEVMGLHLDLVRMGRGWKKELREVLGEYGIGGELRELREENRRLREENERLRRGY